MSLKWKKSGFCVYSKQTDTGYVRIHCVLCFSDCHSKRHDLGWGGAAEGFAAGWTDPRQRAEIRSLSTPVTLLSQTESTSLPCFLMLYLISVGSYVEKVWLCHVRSTSLALCDLPGLGCSSGLSPALPPEQGAQQGALRYWMTPKVIPVIWRNEMNYRVSLDWCWASVPLVWVQQWVWELCRDESQLQAGHSTSFLYIGATWIFLSVEFYYYYYSSAEGWEE